MASSCRMDRATAAAAAAVAGADDAAVFRGLKQGMEIGIEIPCRVPSASAIVFGVSAESMQCDYDSKGNSVPTILLLMQERLYAQDGLKAEGIFRINTENGQEEHVREQLNKGIFPEDIDVHCLAGLIKMQSRMVLVVDDQISFGDVSLTETLSMTMSPPVLYVMERRVLSGKVTRVFPVDILHGHLLVWASFHGT